MPPTANRDRDDIDDDEDDDADLDERDDDGDDDGGDDPDVDKSEEEIRDELKRVRESLSKASGSSKKKRDRIKALERELAEARQPKSKKDGDDDAPDLDAVREAAKAEALTAANDRIKKAEARGALKAAGVPAERVARAVGLIDLGELDVDDSGEVDGLDDAIAALRADWPELFPKLQRKRDSVSGAGDRDGRGDGRKRKLSPSERQAAVALGRVAR